MSRQVTTQLVFLVGVVMFLVCVLLVAYLKKR